MDLRRNMSFNTTFKACEYVAEMFGCDASVYRHCWDNNELIFLCFDWKDGVSLVEPPMDSIFRYYSKPDKIWISALVSMAEGDRFVDIGWVSDRAKIIMGNHYIKTYPKFSFPYICLSDSQVEKVEKKLAQLQS